MVTSGAATTLSSLYFHSPRMLGVWLVDVPLVAMATHCELALQASMRTADDELHVTLTGVLTTTVVGVTDSEPTTLMTADGAVIVGIGWLPQALVTTSATSATIERRSGLVMTHLSQKRLSIEYDGIIPPSLTVYIQYTPFPPNVKHKTKYGSSQG